MGLFSTFWKSLSKSYDTNKSQDENKVEELNSINKPSQQTKVEDGVNSVSYIIDESNKVNGNKLLEDNNKSAVNVIKKSDKSVTKDTSATLNFDYVYCFLLEPKFD